MKWRDRLEVIAWATLVATLTCASEFHAWVRLLFQ